MATIITLSTKAQNPFTSNDNLTMITVLKKIHIRKYYYTKPKIP